MKSLERNLRYIYIYFVYTLTFFISGFIINFLQSILHFALKPYNANLFRKINYYLCYTIYSQLIYLAEWYANVKIVLHSDKESIKYMGKEHAYVIANHKYEIDWLMLGMLCEKSGCAGNFKAYMKKVLQYAPALGWSLYFAENVFLERSFDKDKEIIQKQIAQLVSYEDPMWLILYPEGTRYTPEKYEASLRFAQQKGLPQLKNLLTPRTKGFVTSLPPMKDKMGAIYDITVTFKSNENPTIMNIFLGGKMEAHINFRRIPFEKVPLDEKNATQLLYDMFVRKDNVQESILKTGDYFTKSGVEKCEEIKFSRSICTLISAVFCHTVVMGPVFYYLIKMLFTSTLYNVCVVYGLLFISCVLLSKTFSMSETKKASSSYGTAAAKD